MPWGPVIRTAAELFLCELAVRVAHRAEGPDLNARARGGRAVTYESAR